VARARHLRDSGAHLQIIFSTTTFLYSNSEEHVKMPGVVSRTPAKRALAESTNTAHNIKASPRSAKKRKLESPKKFRKPVGPNGIGSSQPKSQFETEVLEKLSQKIDGLKTNNQEKDQQWARPSLADFNPDADNLTFQQIEIEEGTLHGGKAALKLFGVTEVSGSNQYSCIPRLTWL
jgi:DNA polymerase delta subunit 1